eukprot:2496893-Rhodomonas_salina.1
MGGWDVVGGELVVEEDDEELDGEVDDRLPRVPDHRRAVRDPHPHLPPPLSSQSHSPQGATGEHGWDRVVAEDDGGEGVEDGVGLLRAAGGEGCQPAVGAPLVVVGRHEQ